MHNSVHRTENGRKILLFIRAAVYKNICNYNTLIGVSESGLPTLKFQMGFSKVRMGYI